MNIEMWKEFLLWSSIINMGILLLMFVIFTLGKDLVCRVHGKLYNIPEEKIKVVIYAVLAFYKTCVFFFNVIPYIVLRIISG